MKATPTSISQTDRPSDAMLQPASYTSSDDASSSDATGHIPPVPPAVARPVPAEPIFAETDAATASALTPELTALNAPELPSSQDGPRLMGQQSVDASGDFAKADDYSWVQGKVMKLHSGGGYWQVRYARFDQTDDHGGNFILHGVIPAELGDGDIVRVQGRVSDYDRRLAGTRYEVHNVQVVRKSESKF